MLVGRVCCRQCSRCRSAIVASSNGNSRKLPTCIYGRHGSGSRCLLQHSWSHVGACSCRLVLIAGPALAAKICQRNDDVHRGRLQKLTRKLTSGWAATDSYRSAEFDGFGLSLGKHHVVTHPLRSSQPVAADRSNFAAKADQICGSASNSVQRACCGVSALRQGIQALEDVVSATLTFSCQHALTGFVAYRLLHTKSSLSSRRSPKRLELIFQRENLCGPSLVGSGIWRL